jgi:hypothetical protein
MRDAGQSLDEISEKSIEIRPQAGLERPADHCDETVSEVRSVENEELADKPGSVEDSHSSWARVATSLLQPTRGLCGPHNRDMPDAPLFGLAPSGVYPATFVTEGAVRSYRTISPLPCI